MALTYLIDTSVLTRMGNPSIRAVVEPLATDGLVARATISDMEIGYAARTADEWDQLNTALDAFDVIESSSDHVRRALQVQRQLAAVSRRGRKIPDLLVAAAAEQAGHVVLHYDSDFDLISEATGQACQWVVPPGSVD